MTQGEVTETTMYDLLATRLCKNSGNGPQAVLVPSVRSAAGFDARRTIDAISLGLWPSRGMLLTGYEIKVSRTDWLRELKNPEKAEEFASRLDMLVVVVADGSIVKDGELPAGWGLLVKHGTHLREKEAPKLLHELDGRGALPPGFNRSFLVPLVRAANAIPKPVMDDLRREIEASVAHRASLAQEELGHLKQDVAAFEESAGIKIGQRYGRHGPEEAKRRGAAFRAVLHGEDDLARLHRSAEYIAKSADNLAADARKLAEGEE